MIRLLLHSFIIVFLTVVSQVGGLAWLIALCFTRRTLVFVASYTALSVSAIWIAPMLGREPLPCMFGDALQMQSKMYCVLNRQYVVPELRDVLTDYATTMERDFPNTTTRILDANFPFVSGFPWLPHLSHDDGRKVDLAFYYEGDNGYLPGATRSPVGYFAYEDGVTDCLKNTVTLRWDMAWLQGLWADLQPEPMRMRAALQWLGNDDRVGKVFIEPHLKVRFEAQITKIRFQGCRAARHDDHIHIQL